ncbi:MAG TPA: hypothetical protein VK449_11525 [Anaerolineales bacterium]|nr:hypothetical protein [Anaerolineales bacterium]
MSRAALSLRPVIRPFLLLQERRLAAPPAAGAGRWDAPAPARDVYDEVAAHG